jgi:hypothetical protein
MVNDLRDKVEQRTYEGGYKKAIVPEVTSGTIARQELNGRRSQKQA